MKSDLYTLEYIFGFLMLFYVIFMIFAKTRVQMYILYGITTIMLMYILLNIFIASSIYMGFLLSVPTLVVMIFPIPVRFLVQFINNLGEK